MFNSFVLIVAECNVNNSDVHLKLSILEVLIVAECNVNVRVIIISKFKIVVLIVAECNVNKFPFSPFVTQIQF